MVCCMSSIESAGMSSATSTAATLSLITCTLVSTHVHLCPLINQSSQLCLRLAISGQMINFGDVNKQLADFIFLCQVSANVH